MIDVAAGSRFHCGGGHRGGDGCGGDWTVLPPSADQRELQRPDGRDSNGLPEARLLSLANQEARAENVRRFERQGVDGFFQFRLDSQVEVIGPRIRAYRAD